MKFDKRDKNDSGKHHQHYDDHTRVAVVPIGGRKRNGTTHYMFYRALVSASTSRNRGKVRTRAFVGESLVKQ